jgi:hypothetical protein
MCNVPGCEVTTKLRRGWCQTHYMRWVRHGSPDIVYHSGKQTNWRKHRMYGAWAGMVNRCTNPNNSSYGRYGARGVTVCDRWRIGEDGITGFLCFLADMGERPDGMTLDRIDAKRGYEPGNCRWATMKEQRANRTPEGDQRMRGAASRSKTEYWHKWREDSPTALKRAADVLDLDFEEVKVG